MPELGLRAQGDVKVNSKPSALVKFYSKIKSQISSTKLQINLKSQYSVTKTFGKIATRYDVKSGKPGMMPLVATTDATFVWIMVEGCNIKYSKAVSRHGAVFL
jgi:hypothetical protein